VIVTKRVYIAALGTETNQFVPFPTGLRGYQEHGIWHGDATKHAPTNFTAPMHVWRKETEKRGWTVIEGLSTFAAPSGTTVRRDPRWHQGRPAARCGADQCPRRHGGRRL
jgi:microcystin degradation protein MlrC